MKLKLLYLGAIAGFGFLSMMSFSSGATGNAGDRTGSPLGTATCTGCHSAAGSFSPNLVFLVTDANSTPVTNNTYTPGETYTIRVSVSALPVATIPPTIAQYGYQMTALDGNNAMAGTFANPTTGATGAGNGSKLSIFSGVTYVEHSQRSTDGIFNVSWTAPAAGAGDVTFYSSGIAIDNNSTTGGDNVITTSLTLSESTSTNVNKVEVEDLAYSIFPNPITNNQFTISGVDGEAHIAIHDLMGRLVYQEMATIQGNGHLVAIPEAPKGVYTVSVVQGNKMGTQRIVL